MRKIAILLALAIAATLALRSASAGVCIDDWCSPDSPVSPLDHDHRIYLPLVLN